MNLKNLLASEILARDLCVGCGTCTVVCPCQALSLTFDNIKGRYNVRFDYSLCSGCNLCFRICPIRDFLYEDIDLQRILRKVLNCYIGFSKDERVRHYGSSGGLITQMVMYLLSKRVADAAIVVRSGPKNPLIPEVMIARDPVEVFKAIGSKYAPVPLGISLKSIMQTREKFVVVGLPCHIRAFRNVEKILKLEDRIALYMGLFCNHAPTLLATQILVKRLGINEKDVVEIHYRGIGWPGYFRVRTRNGREISLPSPKAWDFLSIELFTQKGCLICSDPLNTQADISFGDPWLEEIIREEKEGATIAVAFTERGKKMLQDFSKDSNSMIELKKFPCAKAIQSQISNIRLRSIYRMFCFKILKIPIKIQIIKRNTILEAYLSFLLYIMLKAQEKPWTYRLLERAPKQLLTIYTLLRNMSLKLSKLNSCK